MRTLLSLAAVVLLSQPLAAQITITASDMPVQGDMLSYSIASPATTIISPADSGAGINWNYSLSAVAQAVDTYKTAAAVNITYAITISPSAYGYKVADSFPGAPVPVTQIYNFFQKKSSPSRFEAEAFAAKVSSLPTPANYTNPDVWYYFPLSYGRQDSTNYDLHVSIAGLGGLQQSGSRKTRVDGWGTIVTPYFTTPVNCIRVRSEIHETDTVTFGATTIGIPRNTVEYKWLVNGEHYPALWVVSNIISGSEAVTSIRYRDNPHNNLVQTTEQTTYTAIAASPNPSTGIISLDIPKSWNHFQVQVFDMQGKEVAAFVNNRTLDLQSLSKGNYVARVIADSNTGFAKIELQ